MIPFTLCITLLIAFGSFRFVSSLIFSYQQEIPTRFKKEMLSCANRRISNNVAKDDKMMAVEGIEELLENIGVFGKQVTHDDVETIVTEFGAEETDSVRADKILSKIL